ncbi:hypothetical protein NPIL_578121 [Nephila pilipes]|uniref:Uncharacterized protein n=1 Tax=Nephila pilipes TaxID=299642 RepID=A0A8X6P9V1_NEPPI|nr:hypothetical protein NPIL_578121 [Nephila pilipes]
MQESGKVIEHKHVILGGGEETPKENGTNGREAVVKKEHFNVNIDTQSDSVVVTVTVYPCSVGRKPARQTFPPFVRATKTFVSRQSVLRLDEIPHRHSGASLHKEKFCFRMERIKCRDEDDPLDLLST